jgi:hypothetical protein
MKTKYLNGRNCNCVLYLRKLGYKFPYGMWTLLAKKRIINSQTPRAGAIAVINAKYGHMAVVLSVKGKIIKIQEANYRRCRITQRWGTEKELGIVGYYINSKNTARHKTNVKVPAQKTSGFPKRVKVVVPALMVRKRPTTASPLSGSRRLTKGTVIQVNGVVNGQSVSGNNKWYISIYGNYVWSGGLR